MSIWDRSLLYLRKMLVILVFAVVALADAPARAEHDQACNGAHLAVPDGLQMICSNSWQLSGTCNARDLLNQWEVSGEPKPDDSFIHPWTETPIAVVGYGLVKLQSGDNTMWQPVLIGIRAGLAELRQALATIGHVVHDALSLDWSSIAVHRAAGHAVIEQIERSAAQDMATARKRNVTDSWFMIGSAIHPQPDAMLWLGPGETHVSRMWPAGIAHIWPSKASALKGKYSDMIDLHGECFGSGPVTIFLTVYYTPLGTGSDTQTE